MTRFYEATGRWCKRIGPTLVILSALLVGYTLVLLARDGLLPVVQDPQVQVHDPTQLWAQLITAGVILGIGVWAIKTFLTFKDEAVKQAALDRQAAVDAANRVEKNLAERLEGQTRETQELHYALMGVKGKGGLLAAAEADARRRHDLNDRLHWLTMVTHELAMVLNRVCHEAGIPFDHNLLQEPPKRRQEDGG